MAAGTLHASAGTTKKGGPASKASAKSGKGAITGASSGKASTTAAKKPRTSQTTKKSTAPVPQPSAELSDGSDGEVWVVERDGSDAAAGPRHLNVKNKKYENHYRTVVKEALEGHELLYPDQQNKVETILKLFDLEPDYGPAAGMTRLERWKRASSWGLDPPAEVYNILTTVEAGKEERYRDSLFARVC